ncbi:MAG: hypothetical protein JW825_03770 [Candidatus Methanofastidiosa archaeon]|nr:hypothetical protein [Candidatus Methanofastidiosa archaeon]
MLRNYLAIDLRGIKNEYYEYAVGFGDVPGDFKGLMIAPEHLKNRKDIISKADPDVVFAQGKDLATNRKIIESIDIDVLSRPFPIDDTIAKMAQRNEKYFEICARDIIASRGYVRSKIIQSLSKTIELAVKRNIGIVLTSGASDMLETVTPRELVAFGTVLGLTYPQAKGAISSVPQSLLERRGLL